MTGPLDWLAVLFGYSTIQTNGSSLPNERTANLIAGTGISITGADQPATGISAITISATGSVAPIAGVPLTTSQTLTPTVNTTYLVDTTLGPVVFTYGGGAPPEGLELTFIDVTQMWPTNAFTFVSQAGGTVRNPASLGGGDAGSAVMNQLAGGSVKWKWTAQGVTKWLSV